MTDPWVPGQPTTYYGEDAVIQQFGHWYIQRGGNWILMTDEEIAAHLQQQESNPS
jgi:hypothetical protein